MTVINALNFFSLSLNDWTVIAGAMALGLTGSFHCTMMCGGLALASAPQPKDQVYYHLGRLMAYMLLGFGVFFLGKIFQLQTIHPAFTFIPHLFFSLYFMVWGLEQYFGKKLFPSLSFFIKGHKQKLYPKLYRLIGLEHPLKKFSLGLISIFLPCGLLYGMLFSLLPSKSPIAVVFGVLFFFLGTMPGLIAIPTIVNKLLPPLLSKTGIHMPRVFGIFLVFLGLSTLGVRAHLFLKHSGPDKTQHQELKKIQDPPRCH